jgi:chemotaxis response regulator CheB
MKIVDSGDGLCLESGEPVVLYDANHMSGMRGDSPFFVAHYSGFPLLQSYEPSCHFVFEKAPRQYQTSQSYNVQQCK